MLFGKFDHCFKAFGPCGSSGLFHFFGNLLLLHSGTASYQNTNSTGTSRWGDYSAAALDPTGKTSWMFGQFAFKQGKWAMYVGAASFAP